ncbi:hypothetical protein GCM10011348_41300 [Marinobacterium nitratireducens]|uniref:Uncharacterized protein n=1 Tax=Marinobacterium nitratireducens TaxID=518897 RepID=A0A917ZP31_9GAMM|nr:hypothetical protein GCM10011348_41300 [Marinobacterium nitratireducens]
MQADAIEWEAAVDERRNIGYQAQRNAARIQRCIADLDTAGSGGLQIDTVSFGAGDRDELDRSG